MDIRKDIRTGNYIASEKWKNAEFIAISSNRAKAVTGCVDLIQVELEKVCVKFHKG